MGEWITECKSVDGHLQHAHHSKEEDSLLHQEKDISHQLESLPAGGGIDTGVAPRAPRYNRVPAIDHVSLADAERPQSVQVVTLPGIVRPLRQRTDPWSYVVRHCWNVILERERTRMH